MSLYHAVLRLPDFKEVSEISSPTPPTSPAAPVAAPLSDRNGQAPRTRPGRATWTRQVTPDSRRPLIPPELRSKIAVIEAEARAKGWPPELLWNASFWDLPRGLAAVLDADDEIVEVTGEHITILKYHRDLLAFRRHIA